MKKRLVVAACAAALTQLTVNVSAYEWPAEFWPITEAYEQAIKNNDTENIIITATQTLELLKDAEEDQDILMCRGDRLQSLALALSREGRYDESADVYEEFRYYAEKLGWDDSVKILNARVLQYRSELKLYTDGGEGVYYGAKNEPKTGLYFGAVENGPIREYIPNESMILAYHEIENTNVDYIKTALQDARDNGVLLELALNCLAQGDDIRNIHSFETTLSKMSDLLKEYSDVNVILRFGAEFDIWPNLSTPDEFKSAYRYVSDYFKSRNDNVAMSWSPNQVASWYVDIDDYYPGDEYVDWIGVSLYAQPYFIGQSVPYDDYNEVVFKTGPNCDPIISLRDMIETYGDRKPFIISESGQSRYVYSGHNEDWSDWAVKRMNEYYGYLPMVYPQIKAIAYFDYYPEGETNDYTLTPDKEMRDNYVDKTKGARFIQNSVNSSTSYCYREILDSTLFNDTAMFASYVHIYNTEIAGVSYFIDGEQVGWSNELPYKAYVDLTGYEPGVYTLKSVATGENGVQVETERKIQIGESIDDIKVMLDGEELDTENKVVMHNNRTMLPMREIFESLGAEVSWDESTKRASAKIGDDVVEIADEENVIYLNGEPVSIDVPGFIMDSKTYVPVRAVSEIFGYEVSWDSENGIVIINSSEKKDEEKPTAGPEPSEEPADEAAEEETDDVTEEISKLGFHTGGALDAERFDTLMLWRWQGQDDISDRSGDTLHRSWRKGSVFSVLKG